LAEPLRSGQASGVQTRGEIAMHHAAGLLWIAGLVALPALADDAICADIAERAKREEGMISPAATYRVTGPGRLHFHTAPDPQCRQRTVFIIPNDVVIAYSSYGDWFSVMYVNPRTGRDVEGWLPAPRLKYTGRIAPQ
jgi:hypothetical protein